MSESQLTAAVSNQSIILGTTWNDKAQAGGKSRLTVHDTNNLTRSIVTVATFTVRLTSNQTARLRHTPRHIPYQCEKQGTNRVVTERSPALRFRSESGRFASVWLGRIRCMASAHILEMRMVFTTRGGKDQEHQPPVFQAGGVV